MRKKDYELIAGGIRQGLYASEGDDSRTEAVMRTARFLAIEFKLENPRFNKTKFLTACGIDTEHVHDWSVFGNGWKCNGCNSTLDTNEHDTVQD